jgi:hypothetical protein
MNLSKMRSSDSRKERENGWNLSLECIKKKTEKEGGGRGEMGIITTLLKPWKPFLCVCVDKARVSKSFQLISLLLGKTDLRYYVHMCACFIKFGTNIKSLEAIPSSVC